MAYKIKLIDKPNIIEITVTGLLNVEVGRKIMADALVFAEESNTRKLLFDLRNAEIHETIFNAFKFGQEVTKRVKGKNYRIANVYKGDMSIPRFLRTVMLNRGFQFFTMFESYPDAIEWLNTSSGK
jgi:hypothetical protein